MSPALRHRMCYVELIVLTYEKTFEDIPHIDCFVYIFGGVQVS